MRKLKTVALAAAAAAMMTAVFASTAVATPSKTSQCTNCHSGPALAVTATLVSTSGTTAVYNVSAPGAYYIAVFSGTTKQAQIAGSSGSVSLTTGKTYTIFAVQGPTETDGIGSTTVSPAAAVVDGVAPITTSDAVATYVTSATINLSATDAGSGVAATYYALDGGTAVAGTSVTTSVVGPHSLQFWSVDNVGNTEPGTTVAFTVTAAPTTPPTPPTTPTDPPTTPPTTPTDPTTPPTADPVTPVTPVASRLTLKSSAKKVKVGRTVKLRGTLSPADGDDSVKLYVKKPGSKKYVRVATSAIVLTTDANGAWTYTFKATKRGTYLFKVKFAGDADTLASASRTVTVKAKK